MERDTDSDSIDVLRLIITDHDEAAELIRQLEELVVDDRRTSDVMRLAVRLAVTIKTHAKAEERVVYGAICTASTQLRDLALSGPYEHQALDIMLDKLVLHRPGLELKAILKVARELFEHHARIEEEGILLPAIASALPAAELAHLAQEMRLEKRRLQPQIERLVGAPARPESRGFQLHLHAHRR